MCFVVGQCTVAAAVSVSPSSISSSSFSVAGCGCHLHRAGFLLHSAPAGGWWQQWWTLMGGQEEGGRQGWMDVCGEEVLSLSRSRELGICNSALHAHREYVWM